MPFFRKKKNSASSATLVDGNQSALSVNPELSVVSSSGSSDSNANLQKWKGFVTPSINIAKSDTNVAKVSPEKSLSNNLTTKNTLEPKYNGSRLKKVISTVVEPDADSLSDDKSDYDDSDEFDSEENSTYSDYDSEEEEEEEAHLHAIKDRPKSGASALSIQMSTIMGYCGMSSLSNSASLALAANEDLKKTFSLLDSEIKIYRLSSTVSKSSPKATESIISEHQVKLIEELKAKFLKLYNTKSVNEVSEVLGKSKTLYERYGIVKDVIGKGSYGLIKLIDPDKNSLTKNCCSSKNVFYAVKEIQKRPENDGKKQEFESFIEKILSEFVISSSLNYKHIVKTVDLMVTPTLNNNFQFKVSQVMEYTNGTDLFTYLITMSDRANKRIHDVREDEIDCFVKQIAKGVRYMHKHGVAHCDLKLENILVEYHDNSENDVESKVVLKLSDFGKSNVFRTKWDHSEQLSPHSSGPIGSEPYIAPEEFDCCCSKGYSLSKKDCWALGIIVVVMFNIRKYYFSPIKENDDNDLEEEVAPGYLWHTTEPKGSLFKKGAEKMKKYRDKNFEAYMKSRMIAEYNNSTKEFLIKREGSFGPIEAIFRSKSNNHETTNEDISELRKLTIYKLLDPKPESRLSVDEFLKGDWMSSTECCI